MKAPKLIVLAGSVLSIATLISCSNSQPAENHVPLEDIINSMPASGNNSKPVNGTGEAPASLSGNVKLNPAHGQPGHRCDIPDGAPLPVDASAPQPQPQSQPQPVTISTPVQQTASVAKGMNPEHGKPGHRCDIAVGAPLESKASSTPVVTPVSAPAKVASGMNPAHGEPGHRCDLAVGAPLSGEPKKDSAKG